MKFLFLFTLLLFVSCQGSNTGGFEDLNITESDFVLGPVNIESFTPDEDIVYLSTSSITFAVSISPGAGLDVSYKFFIDDVEVQNSSSPFFVLNSNSMTPGQHELKVIATNPISTDEHIFHLYKNTPPVLTHISSSNPEISCSGGSFNMQVVASDVDGDNISFSFLVNGAEGNSGSSGDVTSVLASHTYAPQNCSLQGVQQVTVRATDSRGGSTDYTMAVNVINPNVAAITTFSPTTSPVTVRSTESVNFVIGSVGTSPLTFQWFIDPGSSITRCLNSPSCSLSGDDFSPGAYVLTAKLKDAIQTEDQHSFNVVINGKPRITFKSPVSTNVIRMNCAVSKNFQVTVEDDNFSNPGQNFQVSWTIDGLPSSSIGVTTNLLSHPFTSTATFSPNCSDLLVGNHTITATITDGFEQTSTSWTVQPNYFPDVCNNLLNDTTSASKGKICTLAGIPGQSFNVNTATNPSGANFYPGDIAPYNINLSNAYFVADRVRHAIWFYNGTNSSLSVLGKTVPASHLTLLIGVGVPGLGTAGQSYTNFYLNQPRGMYYDESNDKLYFSDHVNNRVLVVGNDGKPLVFAGGGSSEVDGALNTSHRCANPVKIIRDDNDLIVACYGSRANGWGVIKRFSLTTLTGTTLLKYSADGSGNGVVTEGTLGITGTGGAWGPWAMTKHPTKKLLFVADWYSLCRLYAINYGTSSESLPGISVTIPPNEVRRLSSVVSCGFTYNRNFNDSLLRINPHALEVKLDPVSGELQGLYLVEINSHAIGFFNLSASNVTIAGRVFTPGLLHLAIGSGSPSYSRGAPVYTSTNLYNPSDMILTPSGYILSDATNGRLSRFDDTNPVANSNALVDIVGSNVPFGFDGLVNKITTSHHLWSPGTIAYDSSKNRLLFYDQSNVRLRSIALETGKMDVVLGNGNSGQIIADPVHEQNPFFRARNISDFSLVPNSSALVYTDTNGSYNVSAPLSPPNTNNVENCIVRFWNFDSTTLDINGFDVDPGFVKTFVGDRSYGCANWTSSYNGRYATDVALNNPRGVVYSPTGDIFIANSANHCILKVEASTNKISEFIGLCGTAADGVMGDFATSRFNFPADLQLDSDITLSSSGNFFVVDRAFNGSSSIKYVNLSNQNVDLLNIGTILPNSVGRLVTTEGFTTSVATFENQICYNQGNSLNIASIAHNVICVDRNTGLTTLRIGRSSASMIKAGVQLATEDEGVNASNALLASPFGLAFDSEGNLYITENWAHTIRMVRKWW